jgi:hypothetical protein
MLLIHKAFLVCCFINVKYFIQSNCFPLFSTFSTFIASSMGPYPWFYFNVCIAYQDFSTFCVISLICSLYPVLKSLPIWPSYTCLHVKHFIPYTPYVSYLSLYVGITQLFLIVLLVHYPILTGKFLKILVKVLIPSPKYVNLVQWISMCHVKWVHCHHGMARPQVADGGDAFQIWRVAANILNKQSRTADRWWPSGLGVGRGKHPPTVKKMYVLQSIYKGLGNERILWHGPSTGKWIRNLARGMSGVSIGQANWIR